MGKMQSKVGLEVLEGDIHPKLNKGKIFGETLKLLP